MVLPVAASAAVVGPWAAGPAPAANGTDRPFLQYSIRPGGSINDRISISNFGDTPLTFDLYPADGFDTRNGAFALGAQGQPRRSVGAWITLPYQAVTVPPHTRNLIPFTVDVPLNATPGDHAGGVVALQRIAAEPPVIGKKQVLQRQGIGTRVFVRVAGPLRPGLAITQVRERKTVHFFGGGQGTVMATIENTGDTTLGGTVTFKVSGGLGGSAHFRPITIQTLLPGNSIQVEEPWTSLPFVGPVTVTAQVSYGHAGTKASTTAWVIPEVLEVALAVLLLAAAAIAFRRWRRKRSNPPAPSLAASTQEPAAVGATSSVSDPYPTETRAE